MIPENFPITDKTDISPLHIIEWLFESMTLKTSPNIQYMMHSPNLYPEQLEALCKIRISQLHTLASVRNIVRFESPNDPLSAVSFATYDTKRYLTAFMKKITEIFSDADIKFDVVFKSAPDTICIDSKKTSFILCNLISNSVIHNKSSVKEIRVSASARGDDFIISVRDNGNGIPSSKQKSLFCAYEKMTYIENIDKTGGLTLTGLGLSVSQKEAAVMNGKICYIPSSLYTEFELCIPQAPHRNKFFETKAYIPDDLEIYTLMAESLYYTKYMGS